jgi:hypothetical protein
VNPFCTLLSKRRPARGRPCASQIIRCAVLALLVLNASPMAFAGGLVPAMSGWRA